jgi:beta-xylosidase
MQFTNPLFKRYTKDTPRAQPDPYILFDGGCYYVYASNAGGVALYQSADFDEWNYVGLCLAQDGQNEFWAPCVIKVDGLFYMYYSSVPCGTEDMHEQRIKVAVADKPAGPFRFVRDVLPPFSIDAHVVKSPGGLFLFYSTNNYTAKRPGTYIAVDKMADPFHAEGKPKAAVVPTLDEEIFARDRFRQGEHWHTIEGAFYFFRDGTHYLMYSGGAYTNDTYFIGYATAAGKHEDLRKLTFKKFPDAATYRPLLSKSAFMEGAGHNSLIEIGGSYYILYHARAAGDAPAGTDTRTFRADRLLIKGNRLSVNPTDTLQSI